MVKKKRWHCLPGQPLTELDKQVMFWENKGKLVPTRDLIKTPEQIEGIRLAGIDDSHIRHIALNIFAKLQCHREIDILFFGNSTKCTRIMTAMTRVDNERETAVGACRCQHQHTQ